MFSFIDQFRYSRWCVFFFLSPVLVNTFVLIRWNWLNQFLERWFEIKMAHGHIVHYLKMKLECLQWWHSVFKHYSCIQIMQKEIQFFVEIVLCYSDICIVPMRWYIFLNYNLFCRCCCSCWLSVNAVRIFAFY